jgi:hypothetical protein
MAYPYPSVAHGDNGVGHMTYHSYRVQSFTPYEDTLSRVQMGLWAAELHRQYGIPWTMACSNGCSADCPANPMPATALSPTATYPNSINDSPSHVAMPSSRRTSSNGSSQSGVRAATPAEAVQTRLEIQQWPSISPASRPLSPTTIANGVEVSTPTIRTVACGMLTAPV